MHKYLYLLVDLLSLKAIFDSLGMNILKINACMNVYIFIHICTYVSIHKYRYIFHVYISYIITNSCIIKHIYMNIYVRTYVCTQVYLYLGINIHYVY
jgi:hypothetical protein